MNTETFALNASDRADRGNRAKFANQAPRLDRIVPHSIEAEAGVLGCILLDPRTVLNQIAPIIKTDMMYDLRHQTILLAMLDMYDANIAMNAITLRQKLKDDGMMEEAGGDVYLAELADKVPSAANIKYYTDIVVEKFTARKLVQIGTEIAGRVYDHEGDINSLVDEAEGLILSVRQTKPDEGFVAAKPLVKETITLIEEYHQRKGALIGIETGFTDFDRMTGGLQAGDMIVIAARPSRGKTSLAMNIAEHVAVDLKLPVGVFSLEMKRQPIMLRMLCARARVNILDVRNGCLAERDFPKLTGAAAQLSKATLHVDDTGGLSILDLRARARRAVQELGIKLFVVDYLQLMHSTNKKVRSKEEEISDISSGVKNLAKELNVPVIVLSQLNREIESRDDGKPRLSDLRGSGSVEQDADVVGMLYKPKKVKGEEEEDENADATAVNLLIAKQRQGPTGDVHLTFLKSLTKFESAVRGAQ